MREPLAERVAGALGTFKSIPAIAGPNPLRWVGAMSYEERCTGSLEALRRRGLRVGHANLLRYNTPVMPRAEAPRLLADHALLMNRLAVAAGANARNIAQVDVPPYSATLLAALIRAEAEQAASDDTCLVVDISCLTRFQTMVIASAISHAPLPCPVHVAYSIPDNYVSLATQRTDHAGYERVVVAPLVAGAQLGDEAAGRGIALLGHQSVRLSVALAEVEPPQGLVVRPTTSFRPDVTQAALTHNRRVIERLRELRGWRISSIEFRDAANLCRAVEREALATRKHHGPLFFYLFGPKSLVFAACWSAAIVRPEASWFVYPIPADYNVFASEGLAGTYWLLCSDKDLEPQQSELRSI